ncbi:MAG: class I SAM-dependent methyltransferase [Planctomycetota bacterium]
MSAPSSPPTTSPIHSSRRVSWRHQLARRALFERLAHLEHGELTFHEGGHTWTFGRRTRDLDVSAHVFVERPELYSRLALGGTVGAAEAFMAGWWRTPHLVELVRILVRNRRVLVGLDGGLARVTSPLLKFGHWLRANTRRGSRRNIAAHYDLGNDLYALFLDDTWMYSCGFFEDDTNDLRAASIAKNERICVKLALGPQHHVLDIGGGWGGFALHAATRFGCKVTMTTISQQQHELACERVRRAGLEQRITVLNADYRDLRGTFDRVVSIEMIEAVGHSFHDAYFRCIGDRLTADGMALVQAITVSDQHYDEVRTGVDFIKRYIFPGSCLPSVRRMLDCAGRVSDLRLFHLEDLTPHYALTLAHWRRRFVAAHEAVRALGHGEDFARMWEFYLAYCEGGFAERFTGLAQLVFTKPSCPRSPIAPPTRELAGLRQPGAPPAVVREHA